MRRMRNQLFYGDNLAVLRESIKDASVDLVYLDPPFNSNAGYNVLFKAPAGQKSEAQIEAFEDTWHWTNSAAMAFDDVMRSRHIDAATMLKAMRSVLGENDLMAYLAMMTVRLIELHRVMKPTGSLYLHCDPTASHYLKLLLDSIFGRTNYRSEISWKRSSAHSDAKQGRQQYGNIRDIVFFYTSSDEWKWNWQYNPYSLDYLKKMYRHKEADGRRYRLDNLTGPGGEANGNPVYEVMGVKRPWRYSKEKMEALIAQGRVIQTGPGRVPAYKRYLDEMPGVPLQNAWDDIQPAQGRESLGYPTQKPLALLERIILASSDEFDVVLDPFCGCGTAVHAANKLQRHWIGIDITHLAVSLIERRLKDAFPGIIFDVLGTPKDIGGARDLANRDKYQFQWWAVSLVDAVPQGGKKKGMDRGIDGIRWIRTSPNPADFEKVLVSVKGGETVGAAMVRDLKGTIEREGAAGGMFLTLAEPTKEMTREAAAAGFFDTSFGRHPKIQILTIAGLLAGQKPELPSPGRGEGFKAAPKESGIEKQTKLKL